MDNYYGYLQNNMPYTGIECPDGCNTKKYDFVYSDTKSYFTQPWSACAVRDHINIIGNETGINCGNSAEECNLCKDENDQPCQCNADYSGCNK